MIKISHLYTQSSIVVHRVRCIFLYTLLICGGIYISSYTLYAQESSSENIIIDNKPYEVTNIYTLDDHIQSTIARQKIVVTDPAGIKASIPIGAIISNPQGQPINPTAIDADMQGTKIATLGATDTKTIVSKTFDFGIDNQHLVFSKPVKLEVFSPQSKDGDSVSLTVKHAGDVAYNIRGLSNNPNTSCDAEGNASIPSPNTIVYGQKAIFYTCGASTFTLSYTGGFTSVNLVDRSIATNSYLVGTVMYKDFTGKVITGSNFATGSIITDIKFEISWVSIGGTNAASPTAGNSYPNEKTFVAKSPGGVSVTLFNTSTYGSLWTSCPSGTTASCKVVTQTFINSGTAASILALSTPSSGTYKPAGLVQMATLLNTAPFGTWTISMGDNTNSDGVVILGFKVIITATDPILAPGAPDSLIFPDVTTNSTSQQSMLLALPTTGYFYVEDTLADTTQSWYTTMSMGTMNGPGGSTIPTANIEVLNNVLVTISGGIHTQITISNPVTWMNFGGAALTHMTKAVGGIQIRGTYGTLPQFRITTQPYQSVGQYSGTLTYTIYTI